MHRKHHKGCDRNQSNQWLETPHQQLLLLPPVKENHYSFSVRQKMYGHC